MDTDVKVRIQRPHKTQQQVLDKLERFNHLRCGRRWGKTTLISNLCLPALEGHLIGIWYPTNKDFAEVWKEVKNRYEPVTMRKNEILNQIELITGGIIDFWSMEHPESGQGRKYHRAIIDEAAKAKKLKEAWEHTIRPTLTDYIGDAFFLSRPKGKRNDFCQIENDHKKFKGWAFFHYTSYDNPYLSKEEIDLAKRQSDKKVFAQEYLAEYVDQTEDPFLSAFDEAINVKKCEVDENAPIRLSFDFNINPFAVSIYQKIGLREVNIVDKVCIEGDIDQVCDRILSMYGYHPFIVTGDASGKARSGVVRGKRSYWQAVKIRLKLRDNQIRLRSKNIDLIESRMICNAALKMCDINIDPKCTELINDCNYAVVDEYGILIKDRQHNKNDFLDTFRYLLDAEFPDIITRPKKYA